MTSRTAISTVVANKTYKQFLLLKYSFELFHGTAYKWYVRCDQQSERLIRENVGSGVICSVVCECLDREAGLENRTLLQEKMNSIGDAWASGECEAVVYLDSDLVFTNKCIDSILLLDADLVLSPNYFPWKTQELAPYYGYFSSAFALTRTSLFHEQWRTMFVSQPWKYLDQGCLNEIAQQFSVKTLGPSANVGSWRSEGAERFAFGRLPSDCLFLRVPMFEMLTSPGDWINKMYALHCLRFLEATGRDDLRKIRNRILELDETHWYSASLKLFLPRART